MMTRPSMRQCEVDNQLLKILSSQHTWVLFILTFLYRSTADCLNFGIFYLHYSHLYLATAQAWVGIIDFLEATRFITECLSTSIFLNCELSVVAILTVFCYDVRVLHASYKVWIMNETQRSLKMKFPSNYTLHATAFGVNPSSRFAVFQIQGPQSSLRKCGFFGTNMLLTMSEKATLPQIGNDVRNRTPNSFCNERSADKIFTACLSLSVQKTLDELNL